MSEHEVVALFYLKADQVSANRIGGAKVLCAQLMLFLTSYQLRDCHHLRRKRKVVVTIIEFKQVLKIDLQNVAGRLTEKPVAGLLNAHRSVCIAAHLLYKLGEFVVCKRLLLCPTVWFNFVCIDNIDNRLR